ncbi:DUF3862 domain-containing protein [Clostridium oryzae]|uniref:Beta-lactamase inhibitor (BLIP) n=1 Tax=Clostridium oryzae TaxID=1450648 RepID=A0A1V4IWC3_9CLOT|nr:DUF3862 domain-containing protein [Clostridium oryzae]OPJ64130.1 hypothetical protein CLORY_06770 [Clostridium oryzae]
MKLKKSLSAVLILIFVFAFSIPVSAKSKITYGNFLKVKMGQKYSQVVKILGKKGKKESTSIIGNIKSVMYSWDIGLASMNVTFKNGKVVAKDQTGLCKSAWKITKTKYKKLKKGMSLKKVKSILGKGVLAYQSIIGGENMTTYSWNNASYSSSITCVFYNGKLDSKTAYWI